MSTSRRTAAAAAPSNVTVTEVARLAGVSVGTVSSVLNSPDAVGEARRNRVLQAIETLGYVPNRLAQGLRRGKLPLIGICLPDLESSYFADLSNEVEAAASRHGFEVIQVLSRNQPPLEYRRLAALLSHRVSGLLILPTAEPSGTFDLIAREGVPAVILDRPSADNRFDYVTFDNRSAMLEAARHLVAIGHRRLLYVVRHPKLVTTRRRMAAFRDVAREAGVEAGVMVQGNSGGFRDRLASALDRATGATAVIASNTAVALWTVRALRSLGLAWPGDVSLLVFERPEWADILHPPLSVVETPAAEMADAAWRLLHRRLEGAKAAGRERIELRAALHWEGSVGPPSTA